MRILIAGAGEVGYHVAKLLDNEKQNIFIIDENQHHLDRIDTNLDAVTIKGDATSPEVLLQGEVSKADLLISVTSSQANNLNIAMLGKKLGAKKTIARISNIAYFDRKFGIDFKEMGIDKLISPEMLAAEEIYSLVKQPYFTNYMAFDNGLLHLAGIRLDDRCLLSGKFITETEHLNPDRSFLPVAIRKVKDTIIPRGDTKFEIGDYVYFISKPEGLDRIIHLTGRDEMKVRNVMIMGGSRVGRHTARMLSSNYKVKLIELDEKRCFDISDEQPNIMVIRGDGRDTDLLEEESIREMDAFLSVTGNPATNIMACLTAKNYGVEKTIALVETGDDVQISKAIGIDTLINKKLIAASNIFQYIRQGKVLNMSGLVGMNAELLEFEVSKGDPITRAPLKELKFPKGALIGGAVRNHEAIITLGNFQAQPGDHIVVFSLPHCIQQVEKFFR
ncbi:MAG TPA: Trk system potassium transporter TrkA [Bacteroidia bacterium]|nr:Trk system potassium transporter TrkA [Bacteroidia bacterium]HNT79662.1 Trk system potassium transporter TrkA [Bacteroidia bacterium]